MGHNSKSGRPCLKEEERRRKVTLMLSPIEIDSLKKECEGHAVGFLKLSGSLLLLSRKTSFQLPISADFEQMADNVKEVVQRALYTVNEITYSQSLIMELNSIALDLEKTLKDVAVAQTERESLKSAMKKADDLKKAMEPFLVLYKLKKLRHDR